MLYHTIAQVGSPHNSSHRPPIIQIHLASECARLMKLASQHNWAKDDPKPSGVSPHYIFIVGIRLMQYFYDNRTLAEEEYLLHNTGITPPE